MKIISAQMTFDFTSTAQALAHVEKVDAPKAMKKSFDLMSAFTGEKDPEHCSDCGKHKDAIKEVTHKANNVMICTPCLKLRIVKIKEQVAIMNKRPCQVCGVKGKDLGVNSHAGLTICEECDRRNNPYYYQEKEA